MAYCRRRGITFTRSRPYKKNDSAHVEQKNGQVVRRSVGHDRHNSRKALEALKRLYAAMRHYSKFFQPVMQLQHKTRHGAKVRKVYDAATTPYRVNFIFLQFRASRQLLDDQTRCIGIPYFHPCGWQWICS